jgi:hypothetical protein
VGFHGSSSVGCCDTRVKGKSFWFLQKIWNNGAVPLPAEIAQILKLLNKPQNKTQNKILNMTQNKTFQKKHINTNNLGFQAAKRSEMIFVSVSFFWITRQKKGA